MVKKKKSLPQWFLDLYVVDRFRSFLASFSPLLSSILNIDVLDSSFKFS